MIFTGYAKQPKGFCFYDSIKKDIILSHNATFEKCKFDVKDLLLASPSSTPTFDDHFFSLDIEPMIVHQPFILTATIFPHASTSIPLVSTSKDPTT